jgi:hypothetical protein
MRSRPTWAIETRVGFDTIQPQDRGRRRHAHRAHARANTCLLEDVRKQLTAGIRRQFFRDQHASSEGIRRPAIHLLPSIPAPTRCAICSAAISRVFLREWAPQ